MMRLLICAATSLFLAVTAPAMAQSSAPAHYTTASTQLGTLLADPAAKAVIAKDAPKLLANEAQLEQASGMTLKEIRDALKAYAPDLLTDAVLAQLDTDFAMLPAKS